MQYPDTSPASPFAAVDLRVVAYAAFMSALISVLMTARARNAQAARGLPLTPWRTLIPDVGIGALTGTLLALGVPPHVPWLNTVSGIGFLAGAGGVLGPKLWDLLSKDGVGLLLGYLGSTLAGPLASLAEAAQAKAEASAPPSSTSPSSMEVGDYDEDPIQPEDSSGFPPAAQ
ncbi:MAG: hypothetical protein Q4C67_10445 [Deinococcus sp.]|nr:hypothetical protein [Deinococcus sp.]